MITLGHHDDDYLAICRHYMAIYQTPQVMSDEEKWKEVCKIDIYPTYIYILELVVLFMSSFKTVSFSFMYE